LQHSAAENKAIEQECAEAHITIRRPSVIGKKKNKECLIDQAIFANGYAKYSNDK
jgi:hypothetical protein